MTADGGDLDQLSSGVPGLDTLLNGGFVTGRMYLVIGQPGTGKTLLGSEFLRAGLEAGETVLFIHGEESQGDLRSNTAALSIDIADADFLDVGPGSDFFLEAKTYDVVDPRDVEEGDTITEIREAISELDPDRVLIDPVTHFQYLEPTEYQFRKRLIAFGRFLTDRGTTVLATKTPQDAINEQLRSLSDGVISLSFEDERAGRRIIVEKHRGVGQRDGTHAMEIRAGGLQVYPALESTKRRPTFDPVQFTTGIPALDDLLDGGIERGTVTIISGPTGVGKSTTATEFLVNAARNGKTAQAYLFDESIETFRHRSETFGHPIGELQDEGALLIDAVDSLTLSPEEFAHRIKTRVEDHGADIVVIDGIVGYKNAIKQGEGGVELRQRLRALTQYLIHANAAVILIDQRRNVVGLSQPTSENVSYIADNIVFENYIEVGGDLQRVVGVLKKRIGNFETVPRRYSITDEGLVIGDPMTRADGVLGGMPDQVPPKNHKAE